MVAIKLWAPVGNREVRAKCWIRGKTDNLGNAYAISKWMSTKFPLTVLVMELRRDRNQLADDLSNMKFDSLNMELRVRWVPQEQKWHVLTKFLQHAKEFHEEMRKRKTESSPKEPTKKRARTKGLGPW